MLYACDHVWWRHHFPQVSRTFPGELWSVSEGAREEFGTNWVYGHSRCGGLSLEPHTIHCGLNSGYQAIGLAFLFGARFITLLGYDMAHTNGRTHWHGDHPGKLNNAGGSRFPHWRNEMAALASDLARQGVQVINATRKSALRCFPRRPLEEALHADPAHPERSRNDRTVRAAEHCAVR